MILGHGLDSHAGLAVEPWLFAYGAAFALLIASVGLRLVWPDPRLAAAADGRPAPAWLSAAATAGRVVLQVVAVALFAVTMLGAWFGPDDVGENIAPTAFYLAFWFGLQVLSAVAGDVWRRANPLWLIAAGLDRLRGWHPDTSTATGAWATHWPAATGLLAFAWLELAYAEPASLAAVAVFLTAYAGVVLVGASAFGAGWVRVGDGFAVLFSLLAALAPVRRDEAGRLRLRPPVAGLATVDVRPGTLAVVLVVIGGTTFDGVARTGWWGDATAGRRGWSLTAVNTLGLLLTIATVAVAWLVAVRLVGRVAGDDADLGTQADRWAPTLVPVALGTTIAHHASLVVFEGQGFLALLSDPLDRGWDLFGTAGDRIDRGVVTAGQIAWAQVIAIVVGHVVGLVVAHDRAVARWPRRTAERSQLPIVAALIASAVAGLVLLLGA